MIDLRVKWQTYKGFYIVKEAKGYDVGLNGTSRHTLIKKNNNNIITKFNIINYINETIKKLNVFDLEKIK